VNGQGQLIAVVDEGHLHLAEPPHVLHARVVLGHLEGEIRGIIGVLQRLAVDILIGLLHLVGIDDEAGEQGQVRGLRADLLTEDLILLAAVVVLLNDVPPAGNGLAIGERGSIIIPEGLRAVQGQTVLQQVLVNVRTDIGGILGLKDAGLIMLIEDGAVDILGLKHVGGDVALSCSISALLSTSSESDP
jgi:hypothetical protein